MSVPCTPLSGGVLLIILSLPNRFLCQHLLMLPPTALGVLLVHGGVSQAHIIAFMREQIAYARTNKVQVSCRYCLARES